MLTRLRCLLRMHRWQLQPTDTRRQQLGCADCGKLNRLYLDEGKAMDHHRGDTRYGNHRY
jgi:hypothetical protein